MKIIWVATTGSDATGTGRRTAPYASINRALQDFVSGDQVRILEGTYTPTDSIVISGLEGSLFAEVKDSVYIQPIKTRIHQACLAIVDSPRFQLQGINILQAADNSGNLIGIYAENVETFLCYTCSVVGFDIPSGSGHGIFASGALGRIENCKVADIACAGDDLFGIRSFGMDVVDCTVIELSGAGDCNVTPIAAADS